GLALLFHLLAHRLVLLRPGGPLFSSLLPGLPAVGLLLLFVLLTGSPILLGCLLAFQLSLLLKGLRIIGRPRGCGGPPAPRPPPLPSSPEIPLAVHPPRDGVRHHLVLLTHDHIFH